MAQEFKAFDKLYPAGSDSDLPSAQLATARTIKRWGLPVQSWSPDQVRKAVYEEPGYEDWQRFRVSLKGQSTQVKLYRLTQRYAELPDPHPWYEQCRIDNYIGALKRGGQLDMELNIRR